MKLSEKQLAANRANAQKSTGPKTVGGKRVCSRNATTHGFLAQSILLPGESRARFFDLLRSFITQFNPATPYEYDMVETMHIARWRQLRLWTLETASIIHEQNRQSDATAGENPPTRTMLAAQSLAHPPRSLESLSRYEGRLDRQYHRAADRLFRLQAERRSAEKQRSVEKQENAETQKNAASDPANTENKQDTQ